MTRMQRAFAASIGLVLLCVAVSAQVPAATPRNQDEPATGTIEGKVVNENGQPMAGASLFVRSVSSMITGRTAIADVDGNFRVSGLEPALYTVSGNSPAYTTPPSDPSNPSYYRIGESVRVELIRGGAVTGTVTNSSGDSVIGVRVRATMIRDAHGQSPRTASMAFLEQSTDDRGIYRIYGLSPGTYLVSAGGSGFTPTFNPYDLDVPTFAPSSTRDNAAEITVRSGEDTNVDIRYRGEPGHSISGTVKLSGNTGATITLTPAGSLNPIATTFQLPGARGFALNGLGDGDYDLVVQEATSGLTATTPILAFSDPKRVSIRGADVGGIELSTKPLAVVNGRVTLEPSKLTECQGKRPPLFPETVIRVQRPDKELDREDPLFLRAFSSPASPDASGAFVLRNLLPGRYQFEPRYYARFWYLQSITINSGAAKPQKVDAAAGWTSVKSGDQISTLNITLAEGAASVRGVMPVAEGATLPPGMTVHLIPAEPEKAEDVLRYFVTNIAADGTFSFNSLPPGKYLTLTQTNADPQIATLTKLRQPEAAAARAKLRRTAETRKSEMELKPCQTLSDYQLKQ